MAQSRCAAFTQAGSRCKNKATSSCVYCSRHISVGANGAVGAFGAFGVDGVSHGIDAISNDAQGDDPSDMTSAYDFPTRITCPPDVGPVRVPFPYVNRNIPSGPHHDARDEDTDIDSADASDGANAVDQIAIQAINNRIGMLVEQIKQLKITKTNIGNTKKVATKAKMLYYHDNKTDETILNRLRTGLESVSMVKMENGKPKAMIPWQFVKACTDQNFQQLPCNEKNQYYEAARNQLANL